MSAVARARTLDGCGNAILTANGSDRRDVLLPAFLVKINREESCRFVEEHHISTDNVTAKRFVPFQVIVYRSVVHCNKALVGASRAFIRFFIASALHPLVGTGGNIAAFAGFRVVKAFGVDVLPADEQGFE